MSTDTVTIACKIPNGIILQNFRRTKEMRPQHGGHMMLEQVSLPVSERYEIAGYTVPYGQMPTNAIVGGYALTPGIPVDYWDEWVHCNRDADIVKKGLIFAHEKSADARAEAKEKRTTRSGFEPLDPDRLPSEFTKNSRVKLKKYDGKGGYISGADIEV